jgi:hypothetical protein
MLETWWGKDGEQHLRPSLENFWVRIADALPETILLKPLGALSLLFDRVLGTKPISKTAFWRSSGFIFLSFTISLSITGIFCGKPFGMSTAPWTAYKMEQDFLRIFKDEIARQKSQNGSISFANLPVATRYNLADPNTAVTNFNFHMADFAAFHVDQNVSDLSNLRGPIYEAVYTGYFAILVLVSTTLLNAISISICRLILKEMLDAKASFSLALMFTVNLVVISALLIVDSIILFLGLNIALWPFVPLLFALSRANLLVGAGIILATTWAAWFFTDPWFKVVIVLSLMPSIGVGLVLGGCALGFPFRKAIKFATARFLERGLQNEKGLFPYLGVSVFLIGTVVAGLVKLFSHSNH